MLVLRLVALARCGLGDPDVAHAVPLYGRTAYLIGAPRGDVFEEAARIVPEAEARRLRECLRVAEPETQPLASFREVRAGKHFRYEARPIDG